MLGAWIESCEKKSSSVYENCCGTAPTADVVDLAGPLDTSFSDGKGRVYIPNIFVPTAQPGDGERFIVFGGTGVKAILSANYTGENGELLYERTFMQPNDAGASWDGKIKGDTVYYFGSFTYVVTVEFVDGQVKTYTGQACSFNCGDNGFPVENLPECLFPFQNDGYGSPDPSLPQPIDCF